VPGTVEGLGVTAGGAVGEVDGDLLASALGPESVTTSIGVGAAGSVREVILLGEDSRGFLPGMPGLPSSGKETRWLELFFGAMVVGEEETNCNGRRSSPFTSEVAPKMGRRAGG